MFAAEGALGVESNLKNTFFKLESCTYRNTVKCIMYSRQVTAYNADRHAGHVNLKPTTTGSFRVAAEHMESSGTQHTELRTHIKNKIENYTILIPKGNLHCRRKSSARRPQFKVSSEGLSAEIDIPLQSPIQVQTKADVA